MVAGFHALEVSERTRDRVAAGQVQLLDASAGAPSVFPGISDRDRLFAERADVVVILWDGQSEGTRQLIAYHEQTARALLLAVV